MQSGFILLLFSFCVAQPIQIQKKSFCRSLILGPLICIYWIEFIDKQPMKAGQGLKSSLARKD